MKSFDVFMTLVMLAILAAFVGVAAMYPPKARFMPLVVGIPAIGLCLLQLALDWRARRAAYRTTAAPLPIGGASAMALQAAEPELAPRETLRRELAMWAYVLAFIAGILLFGFWIAIPVFLAAFLRFQAAASWRLTLSLSLAAAVVLYLAIVQGFRIELHRGFVTEAVSDRLGARD